MNDDNGVLCDYFPLSLSDRLYSFTHLINSIHLLLHTQELSPIPLPLLSVLHRVWFLSAGSDLSLSFLLALNVSLGGVCVFLASLNHV